MRINKVQTTNFQKKLIATANVLKNEKPYPCKIYQLEKGIDSDYFTRQGQVWKKAKYLEPVEAELKSDFFNLYTGDSEVYVIETPKGRCLGYCHQDNLSERNDVITLEVHPRYKHENQDRKIKYIGETLLAFLVKLSMKESKMSLEIDHASQGSKRFYTENCGFDSKNNADSLQLNRKKYITLIKQNEKHTKGKIDFTN